MRRAVLIAAALLSFAMPAQAADPYDAVVQSYATHGAFSGAILIVKDGSVVFDRAYGSANTEHSLANQTTTRFHIGTLSMIYTAAVVLRLIERHRINLDNTAGQFVPGLDAGQGAASIQSLLAVSPDAPDAGADYVLLARIAAAASGKSFPDIADDTVFASLLLTGTGIDDGTLGPDRLMAKGYLADGTPAPPADWAALVGAASAFTTTRGAYHWLDMLFDGGLLTSTSRDLLFAGPLRMTTLSGPQGIVPGYSAEGRGQGFSSRIMRFPKVTVIVLANSESADTSQIAAVLAGTALDLLTKAP